MGNINFQKVILKTIATAGLISIVVLAPNALQIIKQFSPKKKKWIREKYYMNNSIRNMLRKGLIQKVRKGNTEFMELTKEGENIVSQYKLGDMEIKKTKRWDGKWRVIIFDISEKKKRLRNLLRFHLDRLGFIKLQNSVWVFPYDCEDLIFLLKTDFFIGDDVLYMEVNRIENEKWLKELFNLK
ncbi:hypothetical protein KKG48_00820 [Patescibacteria group bacterium]|nr:hypothetical protein [Patescibacteria group bacterium]MCG2694684.1 hypothetical protein [Candidatus Parcubacteria bacterium]